MFQNYDCNGELNARTVLASSGLLRGIRWFETDVSGLPSSGGQALQEDSLSLGDVTDGWSRNVRFQEYSLAFEDGSVGSPETSA